MKQILLMIAVVALVGCGKKEPVQPIATNTEATKPEKEVLLADESGSPQCNRSLGPHYNILSYTVLYCTVLC